MFKETKHWRWVPAKLVAILLSVTIGTGSGLAVAGAPSSAAESPPINIAIQTSSIQRVIIVSVDGLRPDTISSTRTPIIWRLMRWGTFSLDAKTVVPSTTLPSHTSMLTGQRIADHGITWNSYQPERGTVQVPTVFSIAHDNGENTAMVIGKTKLLHLNRPGSITTVINLNGQSDAQIAAEAAALVPEDYGVMFVHLPNVDGIGHTNGWMSPEYLDAVKDADAAIKTIFRAVKSAGMIRSTMGIVTADHGGSEFSHGSSSTEDVTIPWTAAGWKLNRNCEVSDNIVTMDTAATALFALGITAPQDWEGTPVAHLFKSNSCPSG